MTIILHLTTHSAWEQAQAAGMYRGDTLDTQGFIHCSTARQITQVANRFFRGQNGLALLCVDTGKVQSKIIFEQPINPDTGEAEPGSEQFPHIYGPLSLDAVVKVIDFAPQKDGTFTRPKEVDEIIQEIEEKLAQQVEAAFADVEYPGDDRLVPFLNQWDYWKIQNNFKGKHWKEINSEIMQKHVYDLPLLAPEAFRFYLPAYLIAALRGSVGDAWEFTFYSLTPPEDEGTEMEDFLQNVSGFNAQQAAIISAFIKLSVETDSFLSKDLKKRVVTFWENYRG